MKIIFLDFDGVLNSVQSILANVEEEKDSETNFCRVACANLRRVLKDVPDAQIVVSSAWRHGRTLEQLRDILERDGGIPRDRVIGKTGNANTRGEEIRNWLSEYSLANTQPVVEEYVAIDDMRFGMEILDDRLIWTNQHHGLQLLDAHRAVRRLGARPSGAVLL